jgi:hypothetical protein
MFRFAEGENPCPIELWDSMSLLIIISRGEPRCENWDDEQPPL